MVMACSCSLNCLSLFFLISAIPIAYIISLELLPRASVVHYHSSGFLRESAKWDPLNRRFLVSFFEGGLGQLVPDNDGTVLKEVSVVKDADLFRNSSLGFSVDVPRNRVVVVYADVLKNKFSAVAAYDLSTWSRLFFTVLSGADDGKAFADDVAVDGDGNSYITDIAGSRIWKVGKDGDRLGTINSTLFNPNPKQWYKNMLTLNGIVYHPDGYLIVIHTQSGRLYKVDPSKVGDSGVTLIDVAGGSLSFGDGMELVSKTKIAIAGFPRIKLVESLDGWSTARVISSFVGPAHRLPTAVTVKDGRVYVNYMIGGGYPRKKHAIVEAVF